MREFHPNSVAVRSGVAVLVVASTLLGTSQRVRAEFKVGEELPEFSLRTADDSSTFSLQRKRDRVLVARGDKQLEPRLVVLDLFQPDCLQCQVQLKVLEELHKDFGNQGVLVVGVAHRGDAEAVRASSKQLKVTFPLVVGKGSKLAKQFAAGDSFAIADQQGVIRFAQVGYGEGDEKVWRENIELLLAGQPVKETTIARERLQGGDRLPVIELSSVMSGKPTALTGEGDRLTFRDETGKVSHPKAAVGFFSRYWDFSRQEMVHLQRFHERFAKDGLQVFVIVMLPDREKAEKLNEELGITYPVFFGHGSDLGKRYAFGWPAYIVDAGGVIRHTQVGFEEGDEKKYEKIIRQVLELKWHEGTSASRALALKGGAILRLGISAVALIGISCMVLSVAVRGDSPSAAKKGMEEPELFAADKIKWLEGPPSLPKGAMFAVLEGDPAKAGPFVFRVKVPDGYRVPPHTHPKTERVTVISGTFNIGMGDTFEENATQAMAAGAYGYWPAGMKHFVWVKGETVVQFHGMGPWSIQYLKPQDDPRQNKK